jgi:hypothetical protein
MPAYLDEDLENVQEERPVPEGEYALRIVATEETRTKADDRDMIVVTIAIEDPQYPDASPFRHWCVLPNEDDKVKENGRTAKMFYRNMKRFLHLFGIPYDFESPEEWQGATCMSYVKLGTNPDSGQEFNQIDPPRIPKES